MRRPSLDKYYLAMLPLVASRGTCPRRQVGAVLVDKDGRLVSTGYNGPPAGMPHCIVEPCAGAPAAAGLGGERALCEAVHAETNAVLQASTSRREPHTLYCSTTPCFNCAKLLVTAGVKRVVAATRYKYDDLGTELLAKAGVILEVMETI